jgi:uncharacterized protein (DUF58 family)
VLSAQDARLLDRLALAPRGLTATTGSPALRHANTRGHGLEVHDFRAYQPGDDPRSIDWTVHARLRQLVVRTTRAEAQLRLHLLMDVSSSMSLGRPSKLAFASKVAAALAYLAVRRREAVGIATFDYRVRTVVAPATGRGQLFRVLSTLRATKPAERSCLNDALSGYGSLVRGPGLVVVLSDFFDPRGTHDGLQYLLHRGLQPALVQVATDDELDPHIDDELELIDVERPTAPPVVVRADAVAAYRAKLAAWVEALESFCRSEAIPWVPLRTSLSFDAVLTSCRRARLVVNHT